MEYEISDRTYPTLYSFDIFDTLISRKVLDPFGIFYYVRERMEEAGGFPRSLVKNYPSIRHTAEFNVREYFRKSTEERGSDRVEITFDLIFERLAEVYNLDDKQIKNLMDWELAAELENVIPLPDRIQMVKDLVEQGETVVLISDMYLPASFIRKMIVKADKMLGELPLFVSSEYGVQKTSGDLFFEVYKSFEPFYDFDKWIHYGDNEKGDQVAPRRLGICTRKVKRPEYSPFQQALVKEVDTADSYLVAALQARMCENNTRRRDRFVINFVSLCMVPYIDWVLEDSMRRGYETLYFISRDGHPLKRIADAMIRERDLPLKTKYIYASRRTWRIPSFIHDIDDGFWRPYGNFNGVTSKDSLLRAMGLDEETFSSLFPAIDLSRID
jgi:predicted HAD superfamily hydrolase